MNTALVQLFFAHLLAAAPQIALFVLAVVATLLGRVHLQSQAEQRIIDYAALVVKDVQQTVSLNIPNSQRYNTAVQKILDRFPNTASTFLHTAIESAIATEKLVHGTDAWKLLPPTNQETITQAEDRLSTMMAQFEAGIVTVETLAHNVETQYNATTIQESAKSTQPTMTIVPNDSHTVPVTGTKNVTGTISVVPDAPHTDLL